VSFEEQTRALLTRFVTGLPERIDRIGAVVASLTDTSDLRQVINQLGRDLHTVKGEARLVGVPAIEALAHAAEDLLHNHDRAGKIGPDTEQHLIAALDSVAIVAHALTTGEPVDDAAVEETLQDLRQALHAESGDRRAETPAVPKAAEPRAERPTGRAAPALEEMVHITAGTLDQLTMVTSRLSSAIVRATQQLDEIATAADEVELAGNGQLSLRREVAAALRELRGTIRSSRETGFRLAQYYGELSGTIRDLRLQPLSSVFSRYPSFVRQVAREWSKSIELTVIGDDVEVDKQVADRIAEPCLHLLRNAVIHGIEGPAERTAAGKNAAGGLRVAAQQDGELVRIAFEDDGRGIDVDAVTARAVELGAISADDAPSLSSDERLKLAFLPGLTTASEVNALAGRGIGLDVVKSVVDGMGGAVAIHSEPGRGARFELHVPASLALIRALVVTACNQAFAIPNASVVEVYWLPVKEIRTNASGHEVTLYRNELLPLVRLREALGLRGIKDIFVNKVGVVVMRAGQSTAGFVVDGFLGVREIVAQPFRPYLGRPNMASGVTLTETGEVVLILHAPDLLRSVGGAHQQRRAAPTATPAQGARRILYAEDSFITREYAAGVMRAHGYDVLEASDGVEALEILERESVDLVLSDLQMPRLDGFKLVARLRQDPRFRSKPVIVLSTLDTPEARQMALGVGADLYLTKNQFSAESLLSTLRQFLG
jgi:chemotaxis protein histidine kinase CheA/CheY-like chemotaxis protein